MPTTASTSFALCLVTALLMAVGGCQSAATTERCQMWIDAVKAEPITFDTLMDDLADVDVIYLGERHTVDRHHAIQAQIIDALGQRGQRLIIAMEQVEALNQPALDRYNNGALTFEQLAEEIDWGKQWNNYADYRPLLDAGRRHGAKVVTLNARSELIRQIGRGGLAALPAEMRRQLPDEINTDDPTYAAHLKLVMGVMAAAMPGRMDKMVEAQIARDEMMAETLCRHLDQPGSDKTIAVVICGCGHVNYGLGTVQRVRRRMPSINDRIVIMSASGDVTLSPRMRAMARDVEITHAQLRVISGRIADYLHVMSLAETPNNTGAEPDVPQR